MVGDRRNPKRAVDNQEKLTQEVRNTMRIITIGDFTERGCIDQFPWRNGIEQCILSL